MKLAKEYFESKGWFLQEKLLSEIMEFSKLSLEDIEYLAREIADEVAVQTSVDEEDQDVIYDITFNKIHEYFNKNIKK